MDKVFGSNILQALPTADGLLIAYCSEMAENKATVGFKRVVFNTGEIFSVPKGFYMVAKFGTEYKKLEEQIENYITCKVLELQNGEMLIYEKSGNAKIFNESAQVVWSGAFSYKNCPLFSADISKKTMWASYPTENALIRYNLFTKREELRLGGSHSALKNPKGIFINANEMIVCSCEDKKLLKVNLSSYAINDYLAFDEPVYEYFEVLDYKFAVLESGLYLI